MEPVFSAIEKSVRMFWQHLPRHPLALLPTISLLWFFIAAQLLGARADEALVLAFLAGHLCRAAVQTVALRAEIGRAQTRLVVSGALLVLACFVLSGAPELLMRWQYPVFAGILVLSLSGAAVRSRHLMIALLPGSRALQDTRWLNAMLVNWVCVCVLSLEYLLWLAGGQPEILVFVLVLTFHAVPMSQRILLDMAVMRERG